MSLGIVSRNRNGFFRLLPPGSLHQLPHMLLFTVIEEVRNVSQETQQCAGEQVCANVAA
jgi:hypothetical protein